MTNGDGRPSRPFIPSNQYIRCALLLFLGGRGADRRAAQAADQRAGPPGDAGQQQAGDGPGGRADAATGGRAFTHALATRRQRQRRRQQQHDQPLRHPLPLRPMTNGKFLKGRQKRAA
ncbi:MAG: hypothetical protein FJX20_00510 [Alphaproteobacteria bacterium]|nr:hypothetical protein [Alphaproteobacteria bacterium]